MPKVLAQWYTRRENVTVGKAPPADAASYCRQETVDGTVDCWNPNCPILHFHLSWYCPQNLSKEALSNNQLALQVMKMNSICTCNAVPEKEDKLVKCTKSNWMNGKCFHLSCLSRKSMPNNSKSWPLYVQYVSKQNLRSP